MAPGTKVYLSWYDFGKKTENICKGKVVDNSLWDGTRWQGYVNVLFQPPHSAGPFCHHFPADKLSLTPDNVPHDDCYLVCGKNTLTYQHDATVRQKPQQPSEAWQAIQQFKHEHWDFQQGHLRIESLEEFYQLWRAAVAAKLGITIEKTAIVSVDPGSPDGDHSAKMIVDTETGEIVEYAAVPQQPEQEPEPQPAPIEHIPIVSEERYYELKQKMAVKLSKKQLRSTGRIEYSDAIQTSLFD